MGPCGGRTAAHPRSRGENVSIARSKSSRMGSSPLTRGKLRSNLGIRGASGLIPAHAGKTSHVDGAHQNGGAHPRSRGENGLRGLTAGPAVGSSPLTRGKPENMNQLREAARLIPAHAGKTEHGQGCSRRAEAHPRSRGENLVMRELWESEFGSSPLTRGKHREARVPQVVERLIPAHAGNTVLGTPTKPSDRAHPRSRGENWSKAATASV